MLLASKVIWIGSIKFSKDVYETIRINIGIISRIYLLGFTG